MRSDNEEKKKCALSTKSKNTPSKMSGCKSKKNLSHFCPVELIKLDENSKKINLDYFKSNREKQWQTLRIRTESVECDMKYTHKKYAEFGR